MPSNQQRFTWQEMVRYWRTHSSHWAGLDYQQDPDGLGNVCYPGAPLWLNRYFARSQRLAYDKLYQRVGLQGTARALEVGCGAGRWCRLLAERGWQVVGVDLQPELIELNRQRYPNLEFHCTPVQEYTPRDPFDLVSAVTVIQHIPFDEQKVVFRRIRDLVRPGGHLITLDSIHFQTPHVFSRTIHDWQAVGEKAGFCCVATRCYDYTPFLRFHDRAVHAAMSTLRRSSNTDTESYSTPEALANHTSSGYKTILGRLDSAVTRLSVALDSIIDPVLVQSNIRVLARHCGFLFRAT